MRDFIIALMTLILILFGIKIVMMDIRIRNVEQTVKRCEMDYQAVLTENEKLERMSDQTLRLVSEGGWSDYILSGCADNRIGIGSD
jgi:hypothetical protein